MIGREVDVPGSCKGLREPLARYAALVMTMLAFWLKDGSLTSSRISDPWRPRRDIVRSGDDSAIEVSDFAIPIAMLALRGLRHPPATKEKPLLAGADCLDGAA